MGLLEASCASFGTCSVWFSGLFKGLRPRCPQRLLCTADCLRVLARPDPAEASLMVSRRSVRRTCRAVQVDSQAPRFVDVSEPTREGARHVDPLLASRVSWQLDTAPHECMQHSPLALALQTIAPEQEK